MFIFRFGFIILGLVAVTSSELTTKEKIRIHKEWLEQRSALKSQSQYFNETSTRRGSYYRKIMKLQNEVDQNVTPMGNELAHGIGNNKNKVFDKGERISSDIQPDYAIQSIMTTPSQVFDIKNASVSLQVNDATEQSLIATSLSPNAIGDPPHYDGKMSTEGPDAKPELIKNQDTRLNEVGTTKGPENPIGPKKTRTRKYPRWGPWGPWSDCSRSCGGGINFQQRRCILKRTTNSPKRIVLSRDCAGLYKRYHLCNEQDCQTNVDFRQQQCSNFDSKEFQGKMYKWEPYIKEDAECELNCKPIGMRYFATLNSSVIDGTPCSRPAEYYRRKYRGRAICVEGICKAVHATGVIAGSFANSGTVHCGGLICRPVSGIFSKTPLPNGYVHVATIPAGASNISITELKHSANFLALKTFDDKYVFNGEYTISASGVYQAAGASFDYRRIDGLTTNQNAVKIDGVTEWIICTGPTEDEVQVMVLGQDPNPGIKFEYLLPIGAFSDSDEDYDSNSIEYENLSGENKLSLKSRDPEKPPKRERRRRKFLWKVVGYSPCSKSCGGGSQTPTIRCVREGPTRYFSARRCTHAEKPAINDNMLRCNTQPCPAYWRVDEWGDCECTNGYGSREREIRCVQELATGIVIQVNNAACMEEEPPIKKKCDCPRSSRRRNRHRLHAHSRAPESVVSNVTNPRRGMDNNKAGVWLISNWNQHCSAECGTGVEHRSIFCDRSSPNTERCDLRVTPDTTRPCENERYCGSGEWFTSPWGQCSGNCFNLTKSREVICIRNQLIVDNDECKQSEKPVSLQNCTTDDVEYCKARWHYSEWTECTKSCDGGTQRRTVKCLELNVRESALKESQTCRYAEREPIYRGCNTESCPDPRVDLIQNDITPTCIDQFSNCHLVAKAKLCTYEYYQQNCCYTCNMEV